MSIEAKIKETATGWSAFFISDERSMLVPFMSEDGERHTTFDDRATLVAVLEDVGFVVHDNDEFEILDRPIAMVMGQ